jgi:hypothetical protein
MNEYCRTGIRAVMEKSLNPRIIEIFLPDVIANLHAQMPSLHAASEFFARRIDILQRHLAKGFQSTFSPAAEFECRIVKQSRAIECVFHRAIIGE